MGHQRLLLRQVLYYGSFCITFSFILAFFLLHNSTASHMTQDGSLEMPLTNKTIICNAVKESKTVLSFPRIVHQTWRNDRLPSKWQQLTEGCQRMNPTFKFILWTDDDLERFISEKYNWFLKTYKSYPYPIERVDAARYFILHHYGGVYIDLDIKCKQPIETLLQEVPQNMESLLGETKPFGITNSMMISKPGHPFMLYIIAHLNSVNGWYFTPYFSIMFSTGPLMVWRAYENYPCNDQVLVLPVYQHNDKYFEHTHGSSWHTWDGPLFVWIDHNVKKVIVFGFLSFFFTLYVLYRKCNIHPTRRVPYSKLWNTRH